MKKLILILCFSIIALSLCFSKGKNSTAPNIKGLTLNGDLIKLSDYQGKVIILDFWASWCSPCREEFPFLIELYHENKEKGLMVIAINLDEQLANMRKFLSKLNTKVPFPIILDREGKIPPIYNVEAMPTTVFIDRKGVVRYRHSGFKESYKRKYINELNILLEEN